VRGIVLLGYTVFSSRDARLAAARMLGHGPLRLKKPLSASGKDQTQIATLSELDATLEMIADDDMATYGLVLEENLRHVRTFSVGEVAVGDLRVSYHGTQRIVSDNEGRPVYGGSDLVCVRGGWNVLDALPMAPDVRAAVAAAARYDEATEEFPGFMAFGASSAELAAAAAFARDPYLQIVRASHVEEYGRYRQPPADAVVDFHGDDPEAGPLLRYTVVKPQSRRLPQMLRTLRTPELIQ
jgi:Protein of unknown function (DUF3182)